MENSETSNSINEEQNELSRKFLKIKNVKIFSNAYNLRLNEDDIIIGFNGENFNSSYEDLKKVLDEEGVSPNYIISRYKQISDIGENDAVTLRALDSLAKISGLFNTEDKKQEQLTVWTGFTPEQIEAIKQEKLVAVGENEK